MCGFIYIKKSLRILNEYAKSVCRRRIDNAMAKIKDTKGQTTIYKAFT